jgi:hypothetical protein
MGQSTLFLPDPDENWWPIDLGTPNATGNQNHVRYAYFANIHRLAVKTGNQVWVYDTLNHLIGGFSQQQGSGSSIAFSSQFGTVDLSNLPVVSRDGQPFPAASNPVASSHSDPVASSHSDPVASSHSDPVASLGNAPIGVDVLTILERLGELREKGIVSDEEFKQKKADLLSRL